ncbi:hypothetical protein AB0P15_10620 [Streptomyces sp. NPDC087917]|uniref:hypothetical protein n=1 Tax=Streptomyces sp. NPDC087917 TaxID=3155060 RepID=UPI0034266844
MTPHSEQAARIEALVRTADPDAVWATGSGDTLHHGPADGADTPLDVGSLIGVLALWPVLGCLVGQGELSLHTPLATYGVPDAADLPAGATAHHLLTRGEDGPALAALTRLAEHLGAGPLADYAARRIWAPLGMTGTRAVEGTLYAPPADLVRFLRHLLSTADHPVPRAWTADSLRIRTGELTPARGLLWHPAGSGIWAHHPRPGSGPALWIAPRHDRWALLLPGRAAPPSAPLRTAFRDTAFAATPAI